MTSVIIGLIASENDLGIKDRNYSLLRRYVITL